jgi:hypothetical protein
MRAVGCERRVMERSSPIVKVARILQRLPLSPLRIFEVPVASLLATRRRPYVMVLLALPRSG